MPMKVFGTKWAIEWSRVYAVRVLELDFYDFRKPTKLALVSDIPVSVSVQKETEMEKQKQEFTTLTLHHSAAEAAWNSVKSDSRFVVVGRSEGQTALDTSKVCLVAVSNETGTSTVVFDLGDDLYRTIALSYDATEELFQSFAKQPR